jgi:hypothetical protein
MLEVFPEKDLSQRQPFHHQFAEFCYSFRLCDMYPNFREVLQMYRIQRNALFDDQYVQSTILLNYLHQLQIQYNQQAHL